jgi:hypothetical protein
MTIKNYIYTFAVLWAIVFLPATIPAQSIETPKAFFGFEPGDDYKLIDYDQLINYLKLLDSQSDRFKMEEIGTSSFGKPIYVLAISSALNLSRLDELKEMNRQLALETDLTASAKADIIARGKVFVAATMSMHSNEVGPSQSVPLIAYELASTNEAEKLRWLDETVLMIVPSHNPDGQDMVVDHYSKYLGTKNEKTSLPGVYHKYLGHNINRDFIMLTQPENQAVSKLFSHHWFPQVAVEKHQMGAAGVRYFVPPPTDPIAENIDAGMWNWIGIFGARMMQRMTADSLKGVTQNYLFDMYWPGPTETSLWKNSISMLTEAANVFHATPVYVEPQEIQVYGKGLSEYKKSINMPEPWPGGWWHLRDIVNYEISSLWGMMDAAAMHRAEILSFRASLTEKMVKLGQTQAPYYYILPQKQHDISSMYALIQLMHDHGVATYSLTENFEIDGKLYHTGDVVIPLAQPFRAFIKEMMEVQEFPVRHYSPGGEMMRPYDVASWSLPLHMGVESFEINSLVKGMDDKLKLLEEIPAVNEESFADAWGLVFPASNNESYKAAFYALQQGVDVQRITEDIFLNEVQIKKGDFLIANSKKLDDLWPLLSVKPLPLTIRAMIPGKKIAMPQIGLVETYFHDMDAGWTRYIFDQYNLPYKVIRPAELKTGVPEGIDILLFPASNKTVLQEGKGGSEDELYIFNYPPAYTKGMGKEGLEKIMAWVNKGGKIISWEASTKLFEGMLNADNGKGEKESFRLPFRDVAPDLSKKGLYVPGSLLQVDLINGHPLTYGMPAKAHVFSRAAVVFATSIPTFDMDRRIIGAYTEKDLMVSGYAKQEELLAKKAAMIWLKKGEGQLVLFGFNPQFRSNMHGTYKLLFNALLLGGDE